MHKYYYELTRPGVASPHQIEISADLYNVMSQAYITFNSDCIGDTTIVDVKGNAHYISARVLQSSIISLKKIKG